MGPIKSSGMTNRSYFEVFVDAECMRATLGDVTLAGFFFVAAAVRSQ